jgi:pimeloyl-ACP methyl ester carboxylesterase
MASTDSGRWGSVEADGPLAVRRWDGPEGLTPLCVHGLGATSMQWALVAEHRRTWGTVVAVDLPGFGATSLDGRAGLNRMARAVGAVVDDHGRQGPVVMCGSSMGVAIALGTGDG